MKSVFSITRFACLAALLFLIASCAGGENVNQSANQPTNNGSNSVVSAKDDAAELGKVVKLPQMPEEAIFREEGLTQQTATANAEQPAQSPQKPKKLVAVLRFTPEDAQKVVEQAERYKPGEFVTLDTESWFPAELIAQSQTAGDATLKGTAYAANDFYQAPYINGRITRIAETDYFVLELFPM